MKPMRLTGIVLAALLAVACLKESRYGTTCILKPMIQMRSTEKAEPLEGVRAYTYAVDTTEWGINSYEDALAGIITRRDDPTRQLTEPAAVAAPYTGPYASTDLPGWEEEGEGATVSTAAWLQLALGPTSQMIVVVDPSNRLYGYTQQEQVLDLPWLYLSTIFMPWKESRSFKSGNWMFFNDFYAPPVILKAYCAPTFQEEEGGETTLPASTQIKAYAFVADTTEWRIASYDDALAGKIVRKANESESRSTPDFQAYREDSGLFGMSVSATPLFVVVVDRVHRTYAYTKESPDLSGEPPVWPLVFRPWMDVALREEEGWQFVGEVTGSAE